MADATKPKSAWMSPERPFWYPDAQGFVMGAVILYVGVALAYRMTHPVEVNDKLLDMMLTILYGTAFVGICNYVFGSSRGSDSKTDTQNKIVEKLTSTQPVGMPGPVAPVAAPPSAAPTWTLLTDPERAAISSQASDPKVGDFVISSRSRRADAADIAYLVKLGLLTQARADVIA